MSDVWEPVRHKIAERQHTRHKKAHHYILVRGSATGGDGGDASPPFLRVWGIIPPPIFRKIMGQIR